MCGQKRGMTSYFRVIRNLVGRWSTAALTLALSATGAQAAIVTYTFVGDTNGAEQRDDSYVNDVTLGIHTPSPTSGSISTGVVGELSFSVNTSQYLDHAPSNPNHTWHQTFGSSSWLTSLSRIDGLLHSELSTSGNSRSYLNASGPSNTGNTVVFLEITDYDYERFEERQYDPLGRMILYKYRNIFNHVVLSSDSVSVGLVDSVELPVGVANWSTSSYFEQFIVDYSLSRQYDNDADQVGHFALEIMDSRYARLPVASIAISISPVPEPQLFTMLGIGLGLIGIRRSRRSPAPLSGT